MHNHTLTRLSLTISFAFFISLFNQTTFARDISNEQSNAREARKIYYQKKSNYNTLTQKIIQQEQRIANEQAKLEILKASQNKLKHELDNAKLDLDTKVKNLNDVWDQRNR